MVYRHAIDATSYVFADLRDLLAKATPPRSGDRLAGIAADSAEQMIAARMALADVPLKQFLQRSRRPLRGRRGHPPDRRQPRRHGLRADLFADGRRASATGCCRTRRRGDVLRKLARGITPEMAAAVSKLMRNQDLILVAKKCEVTTALSQHHRPARADERAAAAQPSLRRCQGHHRLDPRRPPAGLGRCLHRHQSGQRRSGRDRRSAAAARRHHRAAADSDAGLRADPCHDHARTDRAGRSGRSGVPVDRGHGGRQPQFWRRPRAAARGAARPGCRCGAARSATT